jgi:hypothetical protein
MLELYDGEYRTSRRKKQHHGRIVCRNARGHHLLYAFCQQAAFLLTRRVHATVYGD